MEAKLEAAFEGHAITSNVNAIAALSPVVYKVRLRHCDWNVRFFRLSWFQQGPRVSGLGSSNNQVIISAFHDLSV